MSMKKLTIFPIIFILSACQPSELERCIEANIPNAYVPESKQFIFNSYDIVLPETAKKQYKDALIALFQSQIDYSKKNTYYYISTPLIESDSISMTDTGLSRYEAWRKRSLEEGNAQIIVETGVDENSKTVADLMKTEWSANDRYGIHKSIQIYYKNLIDYNKEYYGLTDEVILKIYLEEIELMRKQTATSMCNSQGIY